MAAPIIVSFTATPSSLPIGGGPVTLAWTVQNAATLRIDPGVGDVTGSARVQIPVTDSTTFTLTAVGAGGIATSTASVTVATTITVTGLVTDFIGQPFEGALVYIPGHPPTASDASGAFAIPNVAPPYQLICVTSVAVGGRAAQVYEDLSTANPLVTLLNATSFGQYSAQISGSITGPLLSSGPAVRVDFMSTAHELGLAHFGVNFSGSSANYSAGVQYAGTPDVEATAAAYQLATAPDGGSYFTAFGSTEITLDGGTITGANISVAAVNTDYLNVQPNVDGGYFAYGYVRLSADAQAQVFSGSAAGSTTIPVPEVSGATYAVSASLNGTLSEVFENGVTPAQPIPLEFVPAAELVSPVDGATGVNAGVYFSWLPGTSTPADAEYIAILKPNTSGGLIYDVFTSSTSFQVPDLSPIGIPFPSNAGYSFSVETVAPATEPDLIVSQLEDAETNQSGAVATFALTSSSSTSYTTAP